MCTYSQLKKKIEKIMCNPLRGSMAPLMSQNCTHRSSGIDISNCIEVGSMKLQTLLNYI